MNLSRGHQSPASQMSTPSVRPQAPALARLSSRTVSFLLSWIFPMAHDNKLDMRDQRKNHKTTAVELLVQQLTVF